MKQTALTPKQEAFCRAYIEIGIAADAYRIAYGAGSMSAKTITEKASRMLARGNIKAMIDELRGNIKNAWLWERTESIEVLARIARSTGESADASRDKIAAVKELNSMHGYNAPVKNIHAFSGPDGEPLTVVIKTTYVSPEKKSE